MQKICVAYPQEDFLFIINAKKDFQFNLRPLKVYFCFQLSIKFRIDRSRAFKMTKIFAFLLILFVEHTVASYETSETMEDFNCLIYS
jgi:hypothetical protein